MKLYVSEYATHQEGMYLRNFDLEGSLLVMIDCVGPTKIFCANKALKRKKVVETKHLRHFSFSFFSFSLLPHNDGHFWRNSVTSYTYRHYIFQIAFPTWLRGNYTPRLKTFQFELSRSKTYEESSVDFRICELSKVSKVSGFTELL